MVEVDRVVVMELKLFMGWTSRAKLGICIAVHVSETTRPPLQHLDRFLGLYHRRGPV